MFARAHLGAFISLLPSAPLFVCVSTNWCLFACEPVFVGSSSSLSLSRVWWRAKLLQRLIQAHGVVFVFVFFILCVVFLFLYLQDYYLHSLPPWYDGVPGRGSVFGAEVNAGRLCIFFINSLVFIFLYFCICEIIIFILSHQGFMACQPLEASWVQRLMQADGEIISGELSGFLHIANFKFLHGNHTKL